jgi:hypothetical protein
MLTFWNLSAIFKGDFTTARNQDMENFVDFPFSTGLRLL